MWGYIYGYDRKKPVLSRVDAVWFSQMCLKCGWIYVEMHV